MKKDEDVPANSYSGILGCMLGNAIGDAFGGAVEFKSAQRIRELTGGTWVDQFLPYPEDHGTHPLGIWLAAAPRGTGTDDTRNNHCLVDCVLRNGGFVNSQLLAMEYIARYRDRAALRPEYQDLAEEHYRWGFQRACVHLGMRDFPPGVASNAVHAHANAFPTLMGLISLAFAGLLYAGDPEKAYLKAIELNFIDIGYALDATAMMAAMVSAALGGGVSGRELVQIGLETDPLHFGRAGMKGRFMAERVADLLRIADTAASEQSLVDALARAVGPLHPYDPIDVLGVPMAAIHYTDGDPIRTIVISANDRDLGEDGSFSRLRDVDCTGSVAGAIVGALHGAGAFPSDWVADTIAANKQVYDIDIAANAARFCEAVYGKEAS
jgi:ADP-ribosylglycohydrolase